MPDALPLLATLLLMVALGFWLAARSRGKREGFALGLIIAAAVATIIVAGMSIAGA